MLELQEIRTDMSNTIKAAIAEVVSYMTNKPASTIDIIQEIIQVTNQQALQTQRVTDLLKDQLGR